MEKCVCVLVEYLTSKQNLHLQFVLALKFSKLANDTASLHLKSHQKERLFQKIIHQFLLAASNYVQKFERSSLKPKAFTEFFLNLYELRAAGENQIKSDHFRNYMKVMTDCYRLCNVTNAEQAPSTRNEDAEFQLALEFCAETINNRNQAQQTEKMAKRQAANKANKDEIDSTATTEKKKPRLNEPN